MEGTIMEVSQESDYLRKLGNGDNQAFEGLFLLYYPKVKSFLRGFIKDGETASDMAQDIFFKVWTNRKDISSVVSFKGYLFRMARNMVYDYFEHCAVEEKHDLMERETTAPWNLDIIEEEIYAKELSLLIDIAVDKMPPQRKKIFIMSRKEGFSNEEIAARLQINKRTVENHLTQALSDLRKVVFCFIVIFLNIFPN